MTRRYSAMARSNLLCRSSFSAFRSVPLRSNATDMKRLVHGIKQRRRPERAPVHVGIAEPCNGVEMIRRRVTFVPIEAVPRVQTVQFDHLAVARHLRDNRRGGNRGAPAVAVQDAAL